MNKNRKPRSVYGVTLKKTRIYDNFTLKNFYLTLNTRSTYQFMV